MSPRVLLLAACLPAGRAFADPPAASTAAVQLPAQAAVVAGGLREEAGGGGEDELEEEGGGISAFVTRLTEKLGRLKADARLGPEMQQALVRLGEAVRTFPDRGYARKHPADLARALARQLEFDVQRSSSSVELANRLRRSLDLPVEPLQSLPTDLTLQQYQELGPVVVFLLKHRSTAPQGYLDVTEADLMRGVHHVEIGVKYRGRVTAVFQAEDGDYCWNMTSIHNEIPPEWLSRSGECRPQAGDLIELKGWSYYDEFHKDEAPGEQKKTAGRATVWEVHPVTGCTILERAASAPR